MLAVLVAGSADLSRHVLLHHPTGAVASSHCAASGRGVWIARPGEGAGVKGGGTLSMVTAPQPIFKLGAKLVGPVCIIMEEPS